MIKLMRFVERVSGTLLALLAIGSGNVFVCIFVYVAFLAPR
jgi:hypothetical protein